MKWLFLCALMAANVVLAQSDFAIGRTEKSNNKLVFLWNEPVNEYEVVFSFANTIENINCMAPNQILDASVKNANMEAANQGKLYDAIILGTSDRDLAIIWKDKSKDNALARVKRVEGKFTFLACEPTTNYDVKGKYNVSGVGQQIMFGSCPSHQEKIDKLIKKASKEKIEFDAVIYGSTTNDLAVKFK